MKKIVLFLLLFVPTGLLYSQADGGSPEVLQLCVDLPAIQQYFDADRSSPLQVVLPGGFDLQDKVTKFEMPVVISDKRHISSSPLSPYMQFFIFEVKERSARADYKLKIPSGSPSVVQVYVEFVKTGGDWMPEKIKVEER